MKTYPGTSGLFFVRRFSSVRYNLIVRKRGSMLVVATIGLAIGLAGYLFGYATPLGVAMSIGGMVIIAADVFVVARRRIREWRKSRN